MRKNKKWVKENGEEFKDDDIICVDFATFKSLILNEKHDVAFNYLKKFREEAGRVRESIPKNEIMSYLDGIEIALRDFYLNGEHL